MPSELAVLSGVSRCAAVAQVIPLMVAAGHSAIINVSSLASIQSTGYPYPAYVAAKAAVNQLTVALALRYAADGLGVNVILPGLIDTPLAAHLAPEPRVHAMPPGGRGRELRGAWPMPLRS